MSLPEGLASSRMWYSLHRHFPSLPSEFHFLPHRKRNSFHDSKWRPGACRSPRLPCAQATGAKNAVCYSYPKIGGEDSFALANRCLLSLIQKVSDALSQSEWLHGVFWANQSPSLEWGWGCVCRSWMIPSPKLQFHYQQERGCRY